MATLNKIQDEKLQHKIKRETAKISALSSGKIDKSEYLMGEEIFPSNESRIIEQARFTYSATKKRNGCYYKSKQRTRGFNHLRR